MNIKRNKIDSGDDEIEEINVKVDESLFPSILSIKGIFKAYHMNKKNWIAIALDDEISDEKIMEYVDMSYKFSLQK